MSCEACTKEKARFAALSVDFENLQAELVAKRREIGRLRGELTKQHQSSPEHQSVQSVFDHWRAECGHDKAKLGEKRAAVVRARLRDNFTEDQLLRAVDGVAMFPFERLGRDCVVRGASPKWTVQCPAHDDRDPSLSVREAPDGSVLLHCFAGCKTFDVLQALGLGWADIGSPHAIGRVS
jgi:hypothetical protein